MAKQTTYRLCVAFQIALFAEATALLGGAAVAASSLTAEEVHCNDEQLRRLIDRFEVSRTFLGGRFIPTTVLLTYSQAASYQGMVVTNQTLDSCCREGDDPSQVPPEHYLSFSVNANVRRLLMNPQRPPLPQVTLVREESSTNLVRASSLSLLELTLDPLRPDTPSAPSDLLSINNLVVPAPESPYNGYRAASTAPGRGLAADGLLASCHQKFTSRDRFVFALLQRLIRVVSSSDSLAGLVSFDSNKVWIFRDEGENEYRIQTRQGLAVRLSVEWSNDGELLDGMLEILPDCLEPNEMGCTRLSHGEHAMYLVRPVRGGTTFWSSGDPAVSGVFYDATFGSKTPADDVDFQALLADTVWN